MSCASFSCRVGTATTVKELRDFAREFAASILYVLDTQVHRKRVEVLRHTLGYDCAFADLGFFGIIQYKWKFYLTCNTTLIQL
jgi:hypothetical protein